MVGGRQITSLLRPPLSGVNLQTVDIYQIRIPSVWSKLFGPGTRHVRERLPKTNAADTRLVLVVKLAA